ncbi:endolytic transglycosylase MltG [soil metagenome]
MALSKSSRRFLTVLAVLGLAVWLGLRSLTPATGGEVEPGRRVALHVPRGSDASSIGDLLARKGVLDSTAASAFKIKTRFDPRGEQIQAGDYVLQTGMDSKEALQTLAEGPILPDVYRVTVPEGLDVDQTLAILAEQSPFSAGRLRRALGDVRVPSWVPDDLPRGADPYEGVLFPETYDFSEETSPEELLTRLVQQTESVMREVPPSPLLSPYQVLITGSLIEREALLSDEQRRISSVIHNRLRRGMLLQIDATVLYALGNHKERLIYEDLKVASPWNTYKRPGLPPTPISGAGEAALLAAADPADERYLYYVVVDPDTGRHGFSRTLREHNALRDRVGG